MSDIKRVVLTTLETQKVSEKLVKKHSKTVRICVALAESNEDKCPEYNYKEEVAAVKKKVKQITSQNTKEVNNAASNGLDPMDNDDDVRRIALEMEAKYGTGVSGEGKKKRKGRKDDYADIGMGYDETDSFIDNTDGYDEIIPPNVSAVHGGFYINSGVLEFKADNKATSEVSSSSSEEDSESEEEDNENKPKRKRVLDTTDEEDAASDNSSGEGKEKKQNVDKPNISMHQAIKKKLFSHDKIQVKKRRLADQQRKAAKELLDEKRTDLNPIDNAEKDSLKENRKPMRLSSVTAAIESVISKADKSVESSAVSDFVVEAPRQQETNKTGDQPPLVVEHKATGGESTPVEIVKLPENLPTDILQIIEGIKKSARDYKDGGKVKFFSGEVNIMLLNLERKCKVLGKSSRVKVYEHLAPFVRCRKETLIKRAKNLVIECEQDKLKKTIDKLKGQVDQLMPSLITNYEREVQKVLQKKFSQEAANNEELKNLKAPRRRFSLSEDMRRMIKDIVSLKKRCFLHEGKQKDSLEDLLTEYMKKEILVLWPEGWMSMTVLKKFCIFASMKTPDPKSLSSNLNPSKHSHKPQTSSTSSTIINLTAGNNLTITPVNLMEKLNEVSNNNVNPSAKPDTIVKAVKEKVLEKHEPIIKPLKKEIVVEKRDPVAKVLNKEKSEKPKESKDNGVIVINTTKTKEEPVIPKATHCQVIDLTESPLIIKSKPPAEESSRSLPFLKNHSETKLNTNFENAIKNKLTGISVTTTNTHDRDDVQKVMESLKALQKLSSPSKNETSSPVSVIAFNKNYSNSNSSHTTGAGSNDRTNFSGAIGFQDEFQKQFIGSLNSHKSSSPPSKPNYNKCS